MTIEELKKQYRKLAASERAAGGSITIDRGLPYVAIRCSNGDEYYYQEWQADEVLATVPDWIDAETYLLAQSIDW